MASNTREAQRRLMAKYHIHFDGPIDSRDRDGLPKSHAMIFRHIRTLGRTELDHYRESVAVDSSQRPWREQVPRRAERISALAKMCLTGRKNEAGWRLSLESEILFRLTVEVACRKCSGRLWRSELEASTGQDDGHVTANLKKRQLKRWPCQCGHAEEIHEQGINQLFDDRADEAVVYDAQLLSQLPKREERPDRIYGLRTTKRLERLLFGTDDKKSSSTGKCLFDSLRPTPFRSDGEPILYPFLIVEAKSEKGAASFTDIQAQTAFAIRELLRIQDSLRQAANAGRDSDITPLVWFLSYRGEHWKVSAAYIEGDGPNQNYRVLTLWDGGVDSREAALQLLLVVDYIFDWARDIYREAIILGLRTVGASDSRSLAYDSDIYSMGPNLESWPVETGNGHFMDLRNSAQEIRDKFRPLDNIDAAIRDARYIRSQVFALYVTEDNLQVLMSKTKTLEEGKNLAASLLDSLKRAWRVHRVALDLIELGWTGTDRETADLYPPEKTFLFTAVMVNYISLDWEPTRELCYLAVAETLIEPLLRHANLTTDKNLDAHHFPFVDAQTLQANLGGHFLRHTAGDNLLACISRACLSTTLTSYHRAGSTDTMDGYWVPSAELSDKGVIYRLDAALIPLENAQVYNVVHRIFLQNRIGMSEPTFSLFRTSFRLDQQPVIEYSPDSPPDVQRQSLWPKIRSKVPDFHGRRFLCAVADGWDSVAQPDPSTCIFVMQPTPEADLLDTDSGLPSLAGLKWQFLVRRSSPETSREFHRWNVTKLTTRSDDFAADIVGMIKRLRQIHRLPQHGQIRNPSDAKRAWRIKKRHRQVEFITLDDTELGIHDAEKFAENTAGPATISITWVNACRNGKVSALSLANDASTRGPLPIVKHSSATLAIKTEDTLDVNLVDIPRQNGNPAGSSVPTRGSGEVTDLFKKEPDDRRPLQGIGMQVGRNHEPTEPESSRENSKRRRLH